MILQPETELILIGALSLGLAVIYACQYAVREAESLKYQVKYLRPCKRIPASLSRTK